MDALEHRRVREHAPNHPSQIHGLAILQGILENLYPCITDAAQTHNTNLTHHRTGPIFDDGSCEFTLFGGRKWVVAFVGCFVLGLVGVLGVVLCCLAKKSVSGLIVESQLSPTRATR